MNKSIFKILKWDLICSIATFTCIFAMLVGGIIIALFVPATEIFLPFSIILLHLVVLFGLSAFILSIISLRIWKSQPRDTKRKLRRKLVFVLVASFIGLISLADLIYVYVKFSKW